MMARFHNSEPSTRIGSRPGVGYGLAWRASSPGRQPRVNPARTGQSGAVAGCAGLAQVHPRGRGAQSVLTDFVTRTSGYPRVRDSMRHSRSRLRRYGSGGVAAATVFTGAFRPRWTSKTGQYVQLVILAGFDPSIERESSDASHHDESGADPVRKPPKNVTYSSITALVQHPIQQPAWFGLVPVRLAFSHELVDPVPTARRRPARPGGRLPRRAARARSSQRLAVVPLVPEGVAAARALLAAAALRRWPRSNQPRARRCCRRAGRPSFTTYRIRHFVAVGPHRAGTDIADLQDLWTHRARTTMIYAPPGVGGASRRARTAPPRPQRGHIVPGSRAPSARLIDRIVHDGNPVRAAGGDPRRGQLRA